MKNFLKFFLIISGVLLLISLSFAKGKIPTDEDIDNLDDNEGGI